MQIRFSRGTGVTIDTVPTQLLTWAQRWWVADDGDFCLRSAMPTEPISKTLTENGFNNFYYDDITNVVAIGQNITEEHVNTARAVAEGGEAAPATPRPVAALETDMGEVEPLQREEEPVEGVDYEIEPEEEDDPDGEDEDDLERPFTPHLDPVVDINNDEILKRLPPMLRMEEASAIKLYCDKLREYERVWSQAITMKRIINEMMTKIDENVLLKTVRDDISYLQEKCDDVESVRFGTGVREYNLVITTKEIITDDQEKYGRRRLGAMRITIDLRYLYAQTPPGSNYTKAIEIQNLDRHPRFGGTYWDCGHVHHEDEGSTMSACFGGYYQHIFEAFVSRNLPMLFDTIIRFIKRPYEMDEWGCKVRLFPEVTSES